MTFLGIKEIVQCLEALRGGEELWIDGGGDWGHLSRGRRAFEWLFGAGQRREKMAKALCAQLDALEALAVPFGALSEGAKERIARLQAHAELVSLLLNRWKREGVVPRGAAPLRRRLLALLYRMERVNGGMDRNASDPVSFSILANWTRLWKGSHPLIKQGTLTAGEERRLLEAARYPHFVDLLREDPLLLESFILWTVRDGVNPAPFIEFPALADKLTALSLSSRIGRVNGSLLALRKVEREGNKEKVVTLPFEGVPHSLLDPALRLRVRGGVTISLEEIFSCFAHKAYEVGEFELFAEGIIAWNAHQLGWWNSALGGYERINLAASRWWEALPRLETLTSEQARARYGFPLDGRHWVAAATATRTTATLDFMDSHAFLEVAIPQPDGSYAIYDFGKFAFQFPTSYFDAVCLLTNTIYATVAYPDENIFYSHRQSVQKPFKITPEEGKRMMEGIRIDIVKGRSGNFVYQIESDNCALWVYNLLKRAMGADALPDLFVTHLLSTEPFGLVARIFNAIKRLPASLQTRVLTLCHIPLGAWRGNWIQEGEALIWKALNYHEFWSSGEVYLPARLHRFLDEELEDFLQKRGQPPLLSPLKYVATVVFREMKRVERLLFSPFQSGNLDRTAYARAASSERCANPNFRPLS